MQKISCLYEAMSGRSLATLKIRLNLLESDITDYNIFSEIIRGVNHFIDKNPSNATAYQIRNTSYWSSGRCLLFGVIGFFRILAFFSPPILHLNKAAVSLNQIK